MKIPRDLGGEDLAKLLKKYDFGTTRQTGSHMRLVSTIKGEYHITIPKHKPLKIGTLNSILNSLAHYLEIDKQAMVDELFGKEK